MLKNYFISLLGALTAFWISIMLLFILAVVFAAGTIVSAIGSLSDTSVIADNSVLSIPLSGEIDERESKVQLAAFIQEQELPASLENILDAIAAAKDDKKIVGIFLNCNGASAGIATRKAIREALEDFRQSGKWVYAYGDSYTQGDYYVASVADRIFLNPIGAVEIKGLASQVPFFKGLLDKLGVEMQVIKVGTYKSAVEPYILTSMSEPSREQTSVFLNQIWSNLTGSIAEKRGITVAALNQMADSLTAVTAQAPAFVENKLVDALKYRREVIDFMKEKLNVKKDEDLSVVDYADYLATADIPDTKSEKNKIAVYYAFGDIVDSGDEGISAEQVVPDIIDLADDDDIKAMVLRVNSGGGSAFASEQIWDALNYFKSKGKKLYVSMGDYAASGGYYISCNADKIYAEPVTLTGSIGIFGMIPCVKGLTEKIGVNFDYVTTNTNSAFPTIDKPMTPFQRQAMQRAINEGYELFTKRCADGRHIPQDSIKKIGEGRVWDGMTAKKLGLVDAMGGLGAAVKDLAKTMNYKKYQVVSYPESTKSFWEILLQIDSQMKASALRKELGAMYPVYREYRYMTEMNKVQARVPFMVIE